MLCGQCECECECEWGWLLLLSLLLLLASLCVRGGDDAAGTNQFGLFVAKRDPLIRVLIRQSLGQCWSPLPLLATQMHAPHAAPLQHLLA